MIMKYLKQNKSCKKRGPPIPNKNIYAFPPGKKVTCDSIMYGVRNDIPNVEILKEKDCPENKYKVALFIDEKDKSHHFLRQDKCNNPFGIWSHKIKTTQFKKIRVHASLMYYIRFISLIKH